MSLYTLAADTLTTRDDLRRQPAIDIGQVVRTLSLFIAFAVALVVVAHRSHAADSLQTEIPSGAVAVSK